MPAMAGVGQKPQLLAGKSVQVCHMVARTSYCQSGASNLDTLIWNLGVLIIVLTPKPNVCLITPQMTVPEQGQVGVLDWVTGNQLPAAPENSGTGHGP